jgi:hypothetical protein
MTYANWYPGWPAKTFSVYSAAYVYNSLYANYMTNQKPAYSFAFLCQYGKYSEYDVKNDWVPK